MIAFLAWTPLIRSGPNAAAYPNLGLLNGERFERVMYASVGAFVAEILGAGVGVVVAERMTGRNIWKEYARFLARYPRIFFALIVATAHVLLDAILALVSLEFEKK
ncbi:hypothetical protein HK104_003953 [Borealophlyctis nickersoniae]|nr:hypothetical protein HK104_003953 [Borealophlyctis nickersoniae]